MEKIRRIALVFYLLVGVCNVAHSTSIVFIQYPGGFAVGADAIRSPNEIDMSGQGYRAKETHVCKLRVYDNVVLATYGNAGWDPLKKLNEKIVEVPDLRKVSDRILHTVPGNAEKKSLALERTLHNDDLFIWALGKIPSSPKIAGWVYIDSRLAYEGDFIVSGGHNQAQTHLERDDALAINGRARAYLRATLPKMRRTRQNAIQAVLDALSSANSENSQQVGPPYSVVTVDEKGVRWVDPGSCH